MAKVLELQLHVKVSWLGKPASVFWWVELDLFSLECNEVSSSEFLSVHGFGVTFACVYFCAQFLRCCRISLMCLVLKHFGPWMELGYSVGMDAIGRALVD